MSQELVDNGIELIEGAPVENKVRDSVWKKKMSLVQAHPGKWARVANKTNKAQVQNLKATLKKRFKTVEGGSFDFKVQGNDLFVCFTPTPVEA